MIQWSDNFKYSDYIKLYNQIQSTDDSAAKKIRVAILSSYTSTVVKEIITVELFKDNFFSDIYFSEYNQFMQNIIDENSDLYKSKSDITILAIRLEELYPSIYEDFNSLNTNKIIKDITEQFISIIDNINKNSRTNIIINNFITPIYSINSLSDYSSEDSQISFIRKVNFILLDIASRYSNVHILDNEQIASNIGKKSICDYGKWYLYKNPYKPSYYIELSKEYRKYVQAIFGIRKKCMILDLDNTLWGGIVGEDEIDGIKLGEDYPGKCYKDFQRVLLNLKKNGMLLAVNSKNNYDDAIKVINEHPEMILREKDFAAIKINWNDKATNVKEIASELNITYSDLVFIDDNKAECELIKQVFNEEISIINVDNDLPNNINKLLESNLFNFLKLTEEDKIKTELYKARGKLLSKKLEFQNLEDYYKSLEIVVQIKEADRYSLPRITQLIQKTNQFNITNRRYSEEETSLMAYSDNYIVFYIKAKDKFGDNGIVGVCIVNTADVESWNIDVFLLSCRVMGRNIEIAFMSFIYDMAKSNNVKLLRGEYIITEKNKSIKNFYKDLGFEYNNECYSLNITENEIICPEYIEIKHSKVGAI
ncbi:HAD family hydrolase [Clostridium sp. CTA-7]